MSSPLRLAMWSGPRNISTALLRSFGSRADTAVLDEPLYPYYLATTGVDHPMAEEVIAASETDWKKIVARITGDVPDEKPVWYQKHMAHHLLPELGREWLEHLTHAFLIRRPDAMLASLHKVTPGPSLQDTGLPQQVALFDVLCEEQGAPPPVIDSDDVLADPEGVLTGLCERVGIPFDPAMLGWEPGPRDTDGPWAPAWYGVVETSTGFAPPNVREVELPDELHDVHASCEALYEHLRAHRILPRDAA